jgi:hypothetical protein
MGANAAGQPRPHDRVGTAAATTAAAAARLHAHASSREERRMATSLPDPASQPVDPAFPTWIRSPTTSGKREEWRGWKKRGK